MPQPGNTRWSNCAHYDAAQLHLVLGVSQGKDTEALLRLLPRDGKYYFCQAAIPRALPATALAEEAKKYALVGEVIEDVQVAYEQAQRNAQPDDLIWVGGSSFVVAELSALWKQTGTVSGKIPSAATWWSPASPVSAAIRGNWGSFFGNQHPLTFELGCGKGAYTVGLARLYPEQNFVGVDVKGARLWVGSTEAEEEGLANVAFLRIRLLTLTSTWLPAKRRRCGSPFPTPARATATPSGASPAPASWICTAISCGPVERCT